jgi:hypothetical protein
LLLAVPCAARAAAIAEGFETPAFRLTVSEANGRCEIVDKKAKVTWGEHARQFGQATVIHDGKSRTVALGPCKLENTVERLRVTFSPVPENPAAQLRVVIQPSKDRNGADFSCEADASLNLQSLSLLGDTLAVDDTGRGYLLVPVREGLLIPTDTGLNFTHRFDTYAYEGCHMAMIGLVQNDAAALVTWEDPYVAVDVQSTTTNAVPAGAHQQVKAAISPRKSARSFQVQLLGKGDLVDVAKAYRQVAAARRWLVTWDQKLKDHPDGAKLFGAINYKLWSTLDRRMNLESSQEESVRLNWTFDEAAQVAEHLKRDLKLDKVLFMLGGWIHRGYDNQHPDILPSAPECGGDTAFADCAKRVMDLGYLFCLHDNYQDIYKDSPSWDESYIMKTGDGKIAKGGHWAGGLAYLTCSQRALDLAKRPQNLAAVKKLTGANSYFIDTTYAAGLQECFDPAHPLARPDDMKWKQALSDYAREVFGVFGSECGREWAIPHSDFFEGLTGVSGGYYHDAKLVTKVGGTVVPLFELVYRDCIAMYGKYGYDPLKAAPYVLHHISIGRPLNYHSIPKHLYWKDAPAEAVQEATASGNAGLFVSGENGWTAGMHRMDRFVKNTYEILSPLNELTSRLQMTTHEFLTPDRKVQRTVFGQGTQAVTTVVNGSGSEFTCKSEHGGKVLLPPNGFVIESSTFAAFHALSWNGLKYDPPVMFTVRALDDRPLSRAKKVRVYHAFGNENIKLGSKRYNVLNEAIFDR